MKNKLQIPKSCLTKKSLMKYKLFFYLVPFLLSLNLISCDENINEDPKRLVKISITGNSVCHIKYKLPNKPGFYLAQSAELPWLLEYESVKGDALWLDCYIRSIQLDLGGLPDDSAKTQVIITSNSDTVFRYFKQGCDKTIYYSASLK
jgi:hypothetical protein